MLATNSNVKVHPILRLEERIAEFTSASGVHLTLDLESVTRTEGRILRYAVVMRRDGRMDIQNFDMTRYGAAFVHFEDLLAKLV